MECWFYVKMIYSVVTILFIFQYDFSDWEHGFYNCLVVSHVTEPGSSLTELCAVIKFSDFSSHPVHVCYKSGTRLLKLSPNLFDIDA